MKLNARFLVRATTVVLAVSALLLILVSFFTRQIVGFIFPGSQISVPLGPTPRPPAILAPRGPLPPPPGGLLELKRVPGGAYAAVGSGFLLRLPGGEVIGVTTAHSVGVLGAPDIYLERMAFALPGRGDLAAEFDTLFGPPGLPRTGDDFTVDYVLLKASGPLDEALVLTPDARGAPQAGERVFIYSGLGPDASGQSVFPGTVVEVSAKGAWVRLDASLEPSGMSGSPFISQHTGQVVGMAIVMARAGDVRLIGIHPVGHLVRLAQAAREFPKLADFHR